MFGVSVFAHEPFAVGPASSGVSTFTYAASGGLQTGGTATLVKIKVPVASGGLQSGGSASLVKIKIPTASGGAQLAGSAARAKLKIPTVSGGVQFAGSSTQTKSKTYTPSGGAQLAGIALRLKIKTPAASGGAQFSGAGTFSITVGVAAYTYQGNGNFMFGGRSTNELDTLVPGLAALDRRLARQHRGKPLADWRRYKGVR